MTAAQAIRASLTPWEDKAHKLIAQYCRESYLRANTRSVKRHRPYTVPEIAHALVQALAIHSDVDREVECKRLFEIERTGAWSLI